MRYALFFTVAGIILIAAGLVARGVFYIAIWPGCDFCIIGVAYLKGLHRVLGKCPDGTLPLWSLLLFFPHIVYTRLIWYIARFFSREPACSVVMEQLVVGRRLLAGERKEEYDNYVDLTAEFSEPAVFRHSPAYRNFPILDGAAPVPAALREAVDSLRPGRTFVHCAQGHGRAGLFALAVLLRSGIAPTVEDGLRILRTARPSIHLNREQLKCIEVLAEDMIPS